MASSSKTQPDELEALQIELDQEPFDDDDENDDVELLAGTQRSGGETGFEQAHEFSANLPVTGTAYRFEGNDVGKRRLSADSKGGGRSLAKICSNLLLFLLAVGFVAGLMILSLNFKSQDNGGESVLQLQAINCTCSEVEDEEECVNLPLCFKLALKPGFNATCSSARWENLNGVWGIILDLAWDANREGRKSRELYDQKSYQIGFENLLDEPTSLHWHGLTLPYALDGTPMTSAKPIAPGESTTYVLTIPKEQSGTFLVHSHYSWQMQQGLTTFVLVRKDGDVGDVGDVGDDGDDGEGESSPKLPGVQYDEEVMLFLQDSIGRPECVVQPDVEPAWKCDNYTAPGVFPWPLPEDLPKESDCMCPIFRKPPCLNCTLPDYCPQCPSTEGVDPNDGNDPAFNFCRYTKQQQPPLCLHCIYPLWGFYGDMLANGRSLDDPIKVRAHTGSRVLVRVINAAGSANFQVYFGVLKAWVVAVDGVAVKPLELKKDSSGPESEPVPLGAGQRADVLVEIPFEPDRTMYPLLAQWEQEFNRSGILFVVESRRTNTTGIPSKNADFRAPILDWSMEERLESLAPLYFFNSDDDDDGDEDGANPIISATLNLTDGWVHAFGINRYRWEPYPVVTNFPQRGTIVPPEPNLQALSGKAGEKMCIKFSNQGHTSHPMHLHGHNFQVVEIDGYTLPRGPVRDTIHIPPRCTSAVICFNARASELNGWLLHCHMLEHEFHGMSTTLVIS